jgi:hypothetical protein
MALTQADLDRLEAQHQAVQKEMLSIITKTGVSAEQRTIDNARIKVLNKQAADIVSQQRSAQINTKQTPFNPATSKPVTDPNAAPGLSPANSDKLNALVAKRKSLERKENELLAAQKQGQPPTAEQRGIANQQAAIQKEIDDITAKGSKGGPLRNQASSNNTIPAADVSVAGPITELPEVIVTASRIEETDTITPRIKKPLGPPLPNALHQYPSYTYGISLHLMTTKEYNEIVKDQTFIPNRVLIASAGRHDAKTFPRSKFFNEDFYFEDLEIETVIGLSARSRNTNAIKVSFTIIEPYGLTLLERLIDATKDAGSNSYLDMPYLLQIDFFAQNEAGEIVGKLSDISKYIPIKIAHMKIKAGIRGSEYVIDAFPFNHSAYDQTTISNPGHIEVVAGSISEFFASNQVEVSAAEIANDSSRDDFIFQKVPSFASTATSYAGALNSYYSELAKKNNIGAADYYTFTFDSEIQNSVNETFTTITKSLHSSNKMSSKKNSGSIRISNIPGSFGSADFDSKRKIFSIDAGTSIDKIINYVVRMSNYIQYQLVVPEDYGNDYAGYQKQLDKNKNEYLNWFKIVPTIRLGEWDNKRKMWQRYINYHVQTYIVKNVQMDTAPQQTADSPVKKYEYLYSGKNNDIIDWDLQFNALYYNAMTVYKNSMTAINKVALGRAEEESKNFAPKEYQGAIQDPNAVMPLVVKPIILNAQATTGSTALTAREVAAGDLDESLYTAFEDDMLHVNLKIIGDPAYIKQDDVFYPPSRFNNTREPDPGVDLRLTPNGSLRTDFGELYVQLLFATPRDIDESTGMMSYGEKKQTSVFSGLFKVLTVTSNFSQGAFTQTLSLIRLHRQTAYDYTTPKVEPTQERQAVNENIAPEPTVEDTASATPPPAADPEDGKKAPAAEPVAAAETPVDPNQKDLANVAATAEEKPITTATVAETPPPVPAPPPGPSPEKLALKAELDTLRSQRSAWSEASEELRMASPTLERRKQYLAQGFLNPGEPLTPSARTAMESSVAQLQERVDKATATIAANESAALAFDVVLNKYNAAK